MDRHSGDLWSEEAITYVFFNIFLFLTKFISQIRTYSNFDLTKLLLLITSCCRDYYNFYAFSFTFSCYCLLPKEDKLKSLSLKSSFHSFILLPLPPLNSKHYWETFPCRGEACPYVMQVFYFPFFSSEIYTQVGVRILQEKQI